MKKEAMKVGGGGQDRGERWPRVRKKGRNGRTSDGILRPPFFYQKWCPGRARIIYDEVFIYFFLL